MSNQAYTSSWRTRDTTSQSAQAEVKRACSVCVKRTYYETYACTCMPCTQCTIQHCNFSQRERITGLSLLYKLGREHKGYLAACYHAVDMER